MRKFYIFVCSLVFILNLNAYALENGQANLSQKLNACGDAVCPELSLQLMVRNIQPDTAVQPKGSIRVVGKLHKTVEAGGWIVADKATGKTYLLLNVDKYRNQPWLEEGASVCAQGHVKEDAATIYMQGIPFWVEKMEPYRP